MAGNTGTVTEGDQPEQSGQHRESLSGIPIDPVYGEGRPGEFPYTRGPYASMYRQKPWTMRMFAGFGSAADTNARFHQLLEAGGTGLSTAFDMPTLMGRDSDDSWALGEVGKAGVAVDTLDDMEVLFDGIDLGAVSTSMTINGPAAIVMAMYVAVAEAQGTPRADLSGTLQNDRDAAERHPQGVPGPEGVPLPASAVAAPGHRPDPVHHRRDAAVPPGVDLRLPHP
jgi:methylmalonyl-CoA mutase N-terminal domain/subunit